MAGVAQAQTAEPAAPAVTVVAAWRGSIAERVVVTGDFVAREEVLVTPQIDGHAITEIDAEAGDRVAQGQVLARLSPDTLEAQLAQDEAQVARAAAAIDQAQGSIAEAQANRVEADAAFGRSRALLASGSASRETYDEKLAAAQTAAARLSASQNALLMAQAERALALAQQRELQVNLDRTAIRAPVAGIVSRRVARVGAVVGQSGEALFRIVADGAVELEGLVPEAELARLHPGQVAQVTAPGRDAPLAGRVRLVSPEVDAATRLGRVRLSLATPDPPAIGGFGRGAIEVARHDGVLVPLSAVLFEPDGARVQVVQSGVVRTRAVTLGLQAGGVAEIARGLSAGEAVVAVSGTFVRDGDRVAAVRG
jgi:HlyD family secretion protein